MTLSERIGERIREARTVKKLTQEKLAELLDVSSQAVSNWEQGKFVPDSEHLAALSKVLDVSLDALFTEEEKDWELKPVNSNSRHMFTRVKVTAEQRKFLQTLDVLDILPRAHEEQPRKSRYGFETTYMVHPLTLACHALAMGLRDDDVIAACLAHDMVEDCDEIKLSDLPVNDRVREAVRLMSKNLIPKEAGWEDKYYEAIEKNPLACLVKCLDRVNNVAGMADYFSREKMIRYIKETDTYYPKLLEAIEKVPAWKDASWLLRYQLNTTLEAFKRLL